MGILSWLLVGLIAGAIAKAITPQKERSGWLTSILIGIVGSMIGGFIANATGLSPSTDRGFIMSILVATLGALLVLFLYHRFAARRTTLP
ncbi:MAG: GlsB/YeaQ/YmgE family stress response membrane protein [Saprospiraceae bacterium]